MKPSNLSKANQWRGMLLSENCSFVNKNSPFLSSTEWIFQNILICLLKIFWSKLGAIMTHCTIRECNFLQLGTLFNCWHPTDNCAHVMSYIETVQVETHTEKITNSWEKLNTKEICAHKSNMILLWWNKWQQINRDWFLSLFTTHVWEYNQLIFHDSLHVSGNPLLVLLLH